MTYAQVRGKTQEDCNTRNTATQQQQQRDEQETLDGGKFQRLRM